MKYQASYWGFVALTARTELPLAGVPQPEIPESSQNLLEQILKEFLDTSLSSFNFPDLSVLAVDFISSKKTRNRILGQRRNLEDDEDITVLVDTFTVYIPPPTLDLDDLINQMFDRGGDILTQKLQGSGDPFFENLDSRNDFDVDPDIASLFTTAPTFMYESLGDGGGSSGENEDGIGGDRERDGGGSKTGKLIGVVFSIILAAIILVIALICLRRRSQKADYVEDFDVNEPPDGYNRFYRSTHTSTIASTSPNQAYNPSQGEATSFITDPTYRGGAFPSANMIKSLSENDQETSKSSKDANDEDFSDGSSFRRPSGWKEISTDTMEPLVTTQDETRVLPMSTIDEVSNEISRPNSSFESGSNINLMYNRSKFKSNKHSEKNDKLRAGKISELSDGRRGGSRGIASQRSQREEDYYEDGTFTGFSFGNSNHIDDDEISALPSIKGIEDVWTATEDVESQANRRRSNEISVEDVDDKSRGDLDEASCSVVNSYRSAPTVLVIGDEDSELPHTNGIINDSHSEKEDGTPLDGTESTNVLTYVSCPTTVMHQREEKNSFTTSDSGESKQGGTESIETGKSKTMNDHDNCGVKEQKVISSSSRSNNKQMILSNTSTTDLAVLPGHDLAEHLSPENTKVTLRPSNALASYEELDASRDLVAVPGGKDKAVVRRTSTLDLASRSPMELRSSATNAENKMIRSSEEISASGLPDDNQLILSNTSTTDLAVLPGHDLAEHLSPENTKVTLRPSNASTSGELTLPQSNKDRSTMMLRRTSNFDVTASSPSESIFSEENNNIELSSGEVELKPSKEEFHFNNTDQTSSSRLGVIAESKSKLLGHRKETNIGSFEDLVRFASNNPTPQKKVNDDDEKSEVTKLSEFQPTVLSLD